jgi:hypothetical protein
MDIEIIRLVIRTFETGQGGEDAELVAIDKDQNEYRLSSQVYVDNEYHDVETDIICTNTPEKATPRTCSD